jgi:glycosyltransferase involved in cell wall biosynthesis
MKKKPSVLLVITELQPAGAEKIVYTLATQLREDFSIHVACLSHRRGEVGLWLESQNIPVFYLDLVRKYEGWKCWKLLRYLKENRFDLIHTHLFHANLLGKLCGWLAGCPHILSTLHIVERRFRPWHFWLERFTAPLMDYEVCVSQAVYRFAHERIKISLKKLKCIYNGIPLRPFQEAVEAYPQGLSLKAFLPDLEEEPEWVIGTVGRLSPQKGYPILLEAFLLCTQALSKQRIHLVFVGEGEQRKELELWVKRHRLEARIHFLGRRSDIPRCLRVFNVFVMPSLYEGFGLAAVEAMAAKVLVVASAVDSLPELIEEGKSGFLVPPHEPQRLAEKLQELFHSPWLFAPILEEAQRRAKDFQEERMVEEYRALYYHILSL